MEARKWKYVIKKQMTDLGIYRDEFGTVVSSLSALLEERDKVKKQYKDEGSTPLVTFVSDRGAENKKKNPLLGVWQELERDALQYWRELGLTPAQFKKMNQDSPESKMSDLDRVLWELEQKD